MDAPESRIEDHAADTVESRRSAVAKKLSEADAVLLEGTASLLKSYFVDLEGDPNDGVKMMADNYHGVPSQILLAGACGDIVSSMHSKDSDDSSAWEAFVLRHLEDLVMSKFNADEADKIGGTRKVPGWLRDMLASRRWRRMLLRLYQKQPKSTLLIFCLQRMSAQGLQREIAQTIGVADNFDICRDVYERLFEFVPQACPHQLEAICRDLRGLAETDAFHALLGHTMAESLAGALLTRADELDPSASVKRQREESDEVAEGSAKRPRSEVANAVRDAAEKLLGVWEDSLSGMIGNGRENWLFSSLIRGGIGTGLPLDRHQADPDLERDHVKDRTYPLLKSLCALCGVGDIWNKSVEEEALGKLSNRDDRGDGWGSAHKIRGPFMLHICAKYEDMDTNVLFLLESVARRGAFYPSQIESLQKATEGDSDGALALLSTLAQPHLLSIILDAVFHARKRLQERDPAIVVLSRLSSDNYAESDPRETSAGEDQAAVLKKVSDVCADIEDIDKRIRSGVLVHTLFSTAKHCPVAAVGIAVWATSLVDEVPPGWIPEQMLPIFLPEMIILMAKFADIFPKLAPIAFSVTARALFLEHDAALRSKNTNSVSSGIKLRANGHKVCVDALVHLSVSHGLCLECIELLQRACLHEKVDRANVRNFIVGFARAVQPPLSLEIAAALGSLLLAGGAQALGVSTEGNRPGGVHSILPAGRRHMHSLPQGVLDTKELFQAAEKVVREHMDRHPRPTQDEEDGGEDDWDAHKVRSEGKGAHALVVPESVLHALHRTVERLSR